MGPAIAGQAAFSAFRMLARGGKGFATSRASAQQPITAAEAAAAEAQAQHRQAREVSLLRRKVLQQPAKYTLL